LQEGVEASAASGTPVMEVHDLVMKEAAEDLFRFTCTSADGSSDSLLIRVNSKGGSHE